MNLPLPRMAEATLRQKDQRSVNRKFIITRQMMNLTFVRRKRIYAPEADQTERSAP
jgi:hypothetical protein